MSPVFHPDSIDKQDALPLPSQCNIITYIERQNIYITIVLNHFPILSYGRNVVTF
jgi:hypothetical protein